MKLITLLYNVYSQCPSGGQTLSNYFHDETVSKLKVLKLVFGIKLRTER